MKERFWFLTGYIDKSFPKPIFWKSKSKTKKPAYAGKTGWKAVQKIKFNPKSFPISFPNLGKRKSSHIKQKTIYCIWKHIPYTIYGICGWGSWIRTNEWRSQSPLQYPENCPKTGKKPIKMPVFYHFLTSSPQWLPNFESENLRHKGKWRADLKESVRPSIETFSRWHLSAA